MSRPTDSLSYRDAGVDIDAGDALVERIKPFAKRTMRPEVLAGIGGFGAMWSAGYAESNRADHRWLTEHAHRLIG